MNIRSYFPLAALSCLLTMQCAMFLQHRGLSVLPLATQSIMVWVVIGIMGGMVLFASPLARHFSCLTLTLSVFSTFFFAMAYGGFGSLCWGLAFCCSSMLLPPLFRRLVHQCPHPALQLGIALGISDCFWNFFHVLPKQSNTAVLVGLLVLLQVGAGILSVLDRTENTQPRKEIFPLQPPVVQPLAGVRALLCGVAGFFFVASVLAMSPYAPQQYGTLIPKVLSLYVWLAYPLTGLLLDWKGIRLHLLVVVMAGTALGALGGWFLNGALPYGLFCAVVLACRKVGLVCLIMLFACNTPRRGLWKTGAVLPYMLMLASMALLEHVYDAEWSNGYIALFGILACGLFIYCYMCLQPLLMQMAQLQQSPLEIDEGRRDVRPLYTPDVLESFVERHHITTREKDVLRLIVDGLDTSAIGQTLYLSDNTIKTHVRQLLRKTRARNRITLVAMFFNETGGRAENSHVAAEHPSHPFG